MPLSVPAFLFRTNALRVELGILLQLDLWKEGVSTIWGLWGRFSFRKEMEMEPAWARHDGQGTRPRFVNLGNLFAVSVTETHRDCVSPLQGYFHFMATLLVLRENPFPCSVSN